MLNIASLRFVRRASSALCVFLLAALLSACAHPTPPDARQSKSWIVDNVMGKSTAELYADAIAPAVFERSGSKVIDDYTVESGNLKMPDNSVGSLVTVRSKDGSLTAVVERPGKNGLLVVNSKGESRFTPFPAWDYSLPDTLLEQAKSYDSKSKTMAGPYVIDMLVGFSQSAVTANGGDAHALALEQVESVNLALRNSLVNNVSVRLVGVQIVEQNYSVTGETLGKLPEIFSAGMKKFDPDLLYGIFSGSPDDTAGGWAYVGGRFAIGHFGGAFRHEVGHNAGGGHCHVPGGRYNYGFQNGKTTTAQCGNESPYYSTPAVRDAHGLLIGNAATADMARVWRENAQRLSSYTVSSPKNFRNTGSTAFTATFAWDPSPDAVKYTIYFTSPTAPTPVKTAENVTATTYTARVMSNRTLYYAKAVDAQGRESILSDGASK